MENFSFHFEMELILPEGLILIPYGQIFNIQFSFARGLRVWFLHKNSYIPWYGTAMLRPALLASDH